MATFEVMKKSLETLEKNVTVGKKLLKERVDSLDEMKRNRQEAANDEDRRELKIAIESLETIIDKDRVAVADLEASYKELKEEVDKAEAERVARETEGHVSGSPSVISDDLDRPAATDEVWPEEGERTFTKKEFDAEMLKRGVGTLSYQFEKLCQALAEGEEEKRKAFEEDGGSSRRPPSAPERKRILGTLPSFVTGTTDFQLHMEAFRDFCELNDLTDNPLKVKRLFLTSLDQTARLRCAGLEPDKPPCNTMNHIEYLNRLREMFVPRANLLITQQAFHERKQKAGEIPADFVMAKWSLFKRGWTDPPAPFSFFYEACTAGLLDEALRNEVYREQVHCENSGDRAILNAAFQAYLERVQQCVAYIRRTCGTSNPSSRGLGVVGQGTNLGAKPAPSQSISEVDEDGWNGGEEGWDEPEEVGELTEEEVAVVEKWEDEQLTKMINEESAMVEEAGGPGVKLCFICRGPHLVRSCPQRMKNVSSAMGRMGVVPKWRGSKKGRGGWTKGANRGRSGSLSGHPLQLPPPSTIRPISSSQPGHKRADF